MATIAGGTALTHNAKTGVAISVDAHDPRSVLFTPENKDRFVLSCRDTISAVQCGLGAKAVFDELGALYNHLNTWLQSRAKTVATCAARPLDGHLVVFVVPAAGRYDFALADELTNLDIELAQKFQSIPCEIRQIPSDFPEAKPDSQVVRTNDGVAS